MEVDGFDWDAGNLFKNESKHGISREVIEELFSGTVRVAPDPKHSTDEDRYLALGREKNGRPIIVAFTFRTRHGLRLIRPISARFMHMKEVRKYEQAFTEDEK